MTEHATIALPCVAQALRNLGYPPPHYTALRTAAASALIPVERMGARWYVRRDALHDIAAALKLERRAPPRPEKAAA